MLINLRVNEHNESALLFNLTPAEGVYTFRLELEERCLHLMSAVMECQPTQRYKAL